MPVRTGTHYRGLSEGHRAQTRLTENTTLLEDGSLAPAALSRATAMLGESGPLVLGYRQEDQGWLNLASRGMRDLAPQQQDKMIMLSFWLFRNVSMAKRIIGMLTDYVWGDGLSLNSKNEKLKGVLKEHWIDPRNNWPLRGPQRIRDLFIYGEWLHRPQVDTTSGKVWIDIIQPDKIARVIPSITSHEDLLQVILKAVMLPGEKQPTVDYPVDIIHPVYNGQGEVSDFEGDVFYFGINRTTDTPRGVGELFPLIDYIDLYDDVLFNRAERIATSSSMWWDLEMEGMTRDQIVNYLKDEVMLPPKPGSVWAHNEKSKLVQMTPTLGADDHERDVAVLRSHIIATAGFTGTMFDAPGDAGRAVGAEMSEGVYKAMKTLQEQVNQIIRVELDYVVHCALKAGKLSQSDIDEGYTISFPQPSTRDITRTGPAMARLSSALHQFILDSLLSKDEARRIVITQVNQLGMSERILNADDKVPPADSAPKLPAFGTNPLNTPPGAPPAPSNGVRSAAPTRPAPAPAPAAAGR